LFLVFQGWVFVFIFFFLPTKLMLQGGANTPKQTSNDARTTHDLQISVAAPETLPWDFWNPFIRRALLQASRIFNTSVSKLADPACHHLPRQEAYVKKTLIAAALATTALSMLTAGVFVTRRVAADQDHGRFHFTPDTLVLSRSVYPGNAAAVTVGQTLPPGCVAGNVSVPLLAGGNASIAVTCGTANSDGTYPTVFNNETADGSFGVTSPIFLDTITTEGALLGTLPIPSDQLVTSFSSKSELALNRSTDGKSITFVGYRGGPRISDRSEPTRRFQLQHARRR
jgi:hypothetical protein